MDGRLYLNREIQEHVGVCQWIATVTVALVCTFSGRTTSEDSTILGSGLCASDRREGQGVLAHADCGGVGPVDLHVIDVVI